MRLKALIDPVLDLADKFARRFSASYARRRGTCELLRYSIEHRLVRLDSVSSSPVKSAGLHEILYEGRVGATPFKLRVIADRLVGSYRFELRIVCRADSYLRTETAVIESGLVDVMMGEWHELRVLYEHLRSLLMKNDFRCRDAGARTEIPFN